MAGAGVKKFIVGEVLSDAEVNTYLMDQTVAVFPNAASRDAAFGDSNEPDLSEGRLCYLQSTKKIQFYNGTSWSDSSQFTVTDGTITTEKLDGTSGTEAVATSKIRTGAITTDKLDGTPLSEAVTTAKIRDLAVTSNKLQSSITLAGTTTINGTGKIQQLIEKAVYSATPLTGLQTINALNGAVYYYNADTTNDFQFKLTSTPSLDSLMTVQESITFALFCKQGAIAKRLTAITIDALVTGVTVRWFGGTSYPTGNNNSVDVYTVTVLKTGTNTFDVFASQSPFKA